MEILFRFETLDIWHLANEIGDELLNLADELEKIKFYRFSEQLRASSLSVSNNIAEGSGSVSPREFARFLNYARRSVFENANVIFILLRRKLIGEERADTMLKKLVILSKKITNFKKRL